VKVLFWKFIYNHRVWKFIFKLFSFSLTKNIVLATKAKVVFVATDKNPLIEEIQEHLSYKNVSILSPFIHHSLQTFI